MNHQSTRSLEFGALPLVEAAVRASLGAPQGVTYSLINSIAAELDPTFPQVEEPKQIEIRRGPLASSRLVRANCPGAVFTGNDAGLTVSVHPQVIIARWAKHPRFPEREYPRYGPLREWLWRTVGGGPAWIRRRTSRCHGRQYVVRQFRSVARPVSVSQELLFWLYPSFPKGVST